jgi:hypothetical protein
MLPKTDLNLSSKIQNLKITLSDIRSFLNKGDLIIIDDYMSLLNPLETWYKYKDDNPVWVKTILVWEMYDWRKEKVIIFSALSAEKINRIIRLISFV